MVCTRLRSDSKGTKHAERKLWLQMLAVRFPHARAGRWSNTYESTECQLQPRTFAQTRIDACGSYIVVILTHCLGI